MNKKGAQSLSYSKFQSGRKRLKLSRSAKKLGEPAAEVQPEVAASVVRQYLLPLFEGKKSQNLEVLQNTVYGELKLSDNLLTEYAQAKEEHDALSQKLKDTEQEKASVISELESLKSEYAQILSEISDLTLGTEDFLKEEQVTDLECSFYESQFTELNKLFAISKAEYKQFDTDLHEQKAINDKRKNIAAELEHGNELLKMENDIMAEKLTDLYSEFQTLADRRFVEDKLRFETEQLALALKDLASFCQHFEGQLNTAIQEKEELQHSHSEIEALTQEIKVARDRLVAYSKETSKRLKRELSASVEEREECKLKHAQLEKNYKDLSDAYEKLRTRLKQWKSRGQHMKQHEEKICSRCQQTYTENENFNWACRTHAGTYSTEHSVWWCCNKRKRESVGCLPGKHVSKDEEEEIVNINKPLMCACKNPGHRPQDCPNDPNIRTSHDPIKDSGRIDDMKKSKKALIDYANINARMMGLLEVSLSDESSESRFYEVQEFKEKLGFDK